MSTKPYDESVKKKALELHSQGRGYLAISRELGISSHNTVKFWLKKERDSFESSSEQIKSTNEPNTSKRSGMEIESRLIQLEKDIQSLLILREKITCEQKQVTFELWEYPRYREYLRCVHCNVNRCPLYAPGRVGIIDLVREWRKP